MNARDVLLWVVVPYVSLAIFIVGCLFPAWWLYEAAMNLLGPDPGKIMMDRLGLGRGADCPGCLHNPRREWHSGFWAVGALSATSCRIAHLAYGPPLPGGFFFQR